MTKTKEIDIPILFENDDILAINKPAGIAVHGDGKHDEYTVADWVLEHYPKLKKIGEHMSVEHGGKTIKVLRPGIVHRLDRETSGVMLIAKNDLVYGFLKKKFKEHKIKKTYRTFVYGHIKSDLGTIDAPIGRSTLDIRKWNAGRGARGEIREAKTMYRVINRFETDEITETKNTLKEKSKFKKHPDQHLGKVSYVECYPKTGRTHQIRVHMRFINHPVVSDFLYADNKPKMLLFKRVALHAYKIEAPLPSGKELLIEAPLPKDFVRVIKKYKLSA